MLKSNSPCHIVNTSSSFGLESGKLAPYSVTKQGIVAISEILSGELTNTNVGVSVLCPGWVRTNLLKNTEILGQQHSGISELTPEIFDSININRNSLENSFETGLDPDIVAEKVIYAIKNDIFYIILTPELIQSVQTRFDKINEDFIKLNKEVL
jgi:short-subunit dehydrogenase